MAEENGDRALSSALALASTSAEYGDRIGTHEPTVCLQSPDTKATAPCCSRCLKPLGSLRDQLVASTGDHTLQEVLACPEDGVALPWSPGWSGKLSSAVYFCPRGCGTAFCSEDCYEIANREHHDLL